jgi:type IV pilus assembly protein PilY1
MSRQVLRWLSSLSTMTAIFLLTVVVPSLVQADVCPVESGNTYYIEAENFTTRGDTFEYWTVSDSDANGNKVRKAKVNATGDNPSGNPTGYKLDFQSAGTWYVWVRGYDNDSDSQNSVWYGLDGSMVGNIRTPGTNSSYNWSNIPQRGEPSQANIEIPSAGEHTINFWSREDNFRFDGFYLTESSSNSIPSGNIPQHATVTDPDDCVVVVDPDNDNDDYTVLNGDCNDNNADINPGASEICGDGINNDCDDSTTDVCPVDNDNDGQTVAGGDCNDNNSSVGLGFPELCTDTIDNDCDDYINEGCDADADGFRTTDGDCNDADATIYPGAPELCDSKDNDCDGSIDENCGTGGTVSTGTGNIAQAPLFLTQSATPLVMLNMSNDHQLFFSAYNEYDDLDNDGSPNTTYSHNVNYYGYFDPYKCYDYSTTNDRFEPAVTTTDKYCTNKWSGNFLNWASMGRIDAVRKILYGGNRSTDTSSLTVLERTYLPNDAHSWVKYYPGIDISKLTPFNPASQATTATSPSWVSIGTGPKTFTTTYTSGKAQVGDQITIYNPAAPSSRIMRGYVDAFNSGTGSLTVEVTQSVGSGTYNSWDFVNPTRVGITFCNTTVASGGFSQSVTNPPFLRVAEGNYDLWTANERWQCRWNEEKSISNDNDVTVTGLFANRNSPVKANVGLGQDDYNVRVKVCDSSLIGTERCKRYPYDNYKPVGLLQMYGDDERLLFGLMTGSYSKNKSGGVLRKNISSILDEINVDSDGTFKTPPTSGAIIGTLDKLRLYGYDHGIGYYNSSASGGDNCPYQLTFFNNGRCTNWGNPQSEIFLESLRYFAGNAPNSNFTVSGDDKITGLGSATWSNPLSDANYCAPLNIINFNASMASYDADELETAGSVDLSGAGSAESLTNVIGEGEGIHGSSWFVGENGTDNNQLCTSKTVSSLGDVKGICPESPRLSGSYHLAGLAHFAYTHSIRSDLEDDQTVKTFGVSLAPAVPKIDIPLPGETIPSVTILPACRNTKESPNTNCAIVNFKKISQDLSAGTGAFFVQWEDSEQGGDYDQDMSGVLSYQIDNVYKTITVTTDVFSESTSGIMGFGFTISGTTADGFHAYSGIEGFSYTDDSTSIDGCSSCQEEDAAEGQTFDLSSSSTGQILEQPLYYASKWGGYDKTLDFPTDPLSWDKDGDGMPDNYYFSTDPTQLENSLNEVFLELSEQTSSSSAVAANSTQLNNGTVVYQARFNSGDWSGELLAYEFNLDGTIGDLLWNAGELIPEESNRAIYTSNSISSGVDFLWDNLTTAQQSYLNMDVSGTIDNLGSDRLDYLRGDQSNENQNNGVFRDRISVLGDIVNSDPYYVGLPNYLYDRSGLSEGGSYKSFRAGSSYLTRPSIIYVGANDGMLHAFSAATGVELFAYVPDTVMSLLNRQTERNYGSQDNAHHYLVDGSPKAADVYFGSAWHTVLVESLGGGGRGVFALDVTYPQNFDEDSVLWEINSATTGTGYDYSDLGYPIGDMTIARLPNGKWAALFGNGYNSATGKAMLYIADIADGTIIKAIDVGVGSTSSPNGLSSPAPVDTDGDRIIDTIYAGDLMGNLWKFDVSDNSADNWDAAFTDTGDTVSVPRPLFKAVGPNGEIQPITVRPTVTEHSSGGYMILFGTGKFFEVGDDVIPAAQADREVQSFYGIRDVDERITVTDRSVLLAQIISHETTSTDWDVRVVSNNTITSMDNRGWYLDLISPGPLRYGERVISDALFRNDRIIFVTLIPSSHPCDSGGSSWLMELDAFDGSTLGYAVFNLNGDDNFDDDDRVEVTENDENGTPEQVDKHVSSVRAKNGILQTPTVIEDGVGDEEYLISPDSSGEIESFETLGGGAVGAGRRSWRQLQ